MARIDEAIREAKSAREIDPLSLIMNAARGETFYRARQYDWAIDQLRQTLDMEPELVPAHINLGLSYVKRRGMLKLSQNSKREKNLPGSPEFLGMIGYAHAMAGKTDEARAALGELRRLAERQYVSPFHMAAIHRALGEKDSAFAWLEKSHNERSCTWDFYELIPPSIRFDQTRAFLAGLHQTWTDIQIQSNTLWQRKIG